ncbi:MAG: DUF839 domain-containing protein [Anaerolineae bacterium]
MLGASDYGWERFDPARRDGRTEPNEAFRFGWVVEIDPLDPASAPRKRTALGRFRHEGAATVVAPGGQVVLFYTGDDELSTSTSSSAAGRPGRWRGGERRR